MKPRSACLVVAALFLCVQPVTAQVARRLPRGGPRPLPKGDRVLAVSVTEPEDGDYDAAFALAQGAGMEAMGLALFWDDLETAPWTYGPDPNWLEIMNLYYPPTGVRISLEIDPIDTNNLRVPPDLAWLPFDHPLVIARFMGLLDWVFSQIPDLALVDLVIGNEIDVYLGSDPIAWGRYRTFFEQTSAYARTLRPGLVVGAKATMSGLTGSARTHLQALNQASDVVMATYYPLNADYTVRPPSVVEGDLATLVADYSGAPIFLLEAGYPAGTLCNSSEALQAEFVRAVFQAWDGFRDEIRLIEFTWLHDVSAAQVDTWAAYYGISDPIFKEYLKTLGLRTFPGSGMDKPGFAALGREARRRGW